MSDSQDGTPESDASSSVATSQVHTISINCTGCTETYSVSDDDGLAGMSFPCDNCGGMVEVPELPWEDHETTTYEAPLSPMEMKLADIPEEQAIEGGTGINVTCFSCLEEYNVSADDGLAGMAFPCDNCGAEVEVPNHPWPEDEPQVQEQDDFFNVGTPLTEEEVAERDAQAQLQDTLDGLEALPEAKDIPEIEGGTAITVMCFSCLEEYNVSADDGLAGIEFPCSNCGADVQVPEHPWPDDAPEQDYDDDFFNVGTPLTEDELAERDKVREKEEEQEAELEEPAHTAAPEEKAPAPAPEPEPKKAPEPVETAPPPARKPSKKPSKEQREKKEKKAKKEKPKKKKAKESPGKKDVISDEETTLPSAPRTAPPRATGDAPRRPAAQASSGRARGETAGGTPAGGGGARGAGARRPSAVPGGGRRLHARQTEPGATVKVVHERVDMGPEPDDVPTQAFQAPPRPPPKAAKERKRFREPDRPRVEMRSGGITAPSGSYGVGGGDAKEPDEVTVRVQSSKPKAAYVDEPAEPTITKSQRTRPSERTANAKPTAPKDPIVVRVVTPFFSGMKKLFSRNTTKSQENTGHNVQEPPSPESMAPERTPSISASQQAARRRQVQIIHEQRDDIRRGVGVRDNAETGEAGDEPEQEAAEPTPPDELARLQRIRNMKLAAATLLVVAPLVIFKDVLFGPLLGDKARPEVEKQFWENREIEASEKIDQPTVDLSEMLGADEEAKQEVAQPISAENVDSLGYRNLRNQVDLLTAQQPPADKSLLLWARFRLAVAYNDPVAKKLLIAAAPKRLNSEEYGPMGLAGAAGAMVLQGKGGKARKLVSKLAPSEGRDSAQMNFVMALSQKNRGGGEKALELLSGALDKNSQMTDAVLLRAEILQKHGKERETWPNELLTLLEATSDPDSAVRGGHLLLEAGAFAELEKLFSEFETVPATGAISPSRRAPFAKLLSGSYLRRADFKNAHVALATRIEGEASSSAIVEVSRLADAAGEDGLEVLNRNTGLLGGGADQARIYHARGKWHLDNAAPRHAEAVLKEAKSRPGVRGTPWMHLLDARIANASGRTAAARKALRKAVKGRQKNPQALYAKESLLSSGLPLARLEQLNRRLKTPDLQLDLAKAQATQGKLDEARAQFEDLLWNKPGASDPVETVLGWLDVVDRQGETERARSLAENVQKSHPGDLRAVDQLITIATRHFDEEGAATWMRAKIRLEQKQQATADKRAASAAEGSQTGDLGSQKPQPGTESGAPAVPDGATGSPGETP